MYPCLPLYMPQYILPYDGGAYVVVQEFGHGVPVPPPVGLGFEFGKLVLAGGEYDVADPVLGAGVSGEFHHLEGVEDDGFGMHGEL